MQKSGGVDEVIGVIFFAVRAFPEKSESGHPVGRCFACGIFFYDNKFIASGEGGNKLFFKACGAAVSMRLKYDNQLVFFEKRGGIKRFRNFSRVMSVIGIYGSGKEFSAVIETSVNAVEIIESGFNVFA